MKKVGITATKAQISLFVIVAILIVILVAGFFIFRNKLDLSSSVVPTELSPITDSIQNCVQTTLEDGTKLAGLQGGYVLPPVNALETNFSYIAYGYDTGSNILASKTKIESEISGYMQLALPLCFRISDFPAYKIDISTAKVETKINAESIATSVNFPFTASKQNNSWKIDKRYSAEYNAKVGKIYDVAQGIITKEIQNPKSIDMTFLSNFNYPISLSYEGNNIIVYSIKDNNSNENGGYSFRFANRLR